MRLVWTARVLALIALTGLLCSCGGSGGGDSQPPTMPGQQPGAGGTGGTFQPKK